MNENILVHMFYKIVQNLAQNPVIYLNMFTKVNSAKSLPHKA